MTRGGAAVVDVEVDGTLFAGAFDVDVDPVVPLVVPVVEVPLVGGAGVVVF
jgi:hypothetical protein